MDRMLDKINFSELTTESVVIYLYSFLTILYSACILLILPIVYVNVNNTCNITCRVNIYIIVIQYITLFCALILYWYKGINNKGRTLSIRVILLNFLNIITTFLFMTFLFFMIGILEDEGKYEIYLMLSEGFIQIYMLVIVIFSFFLFENQVETNV